LYVAKNVFRERVHFKENEKETLQGKMRRTLEQE
jgi:hypothetical protein